MPRLRRGNRRCRGFAAERAPSGVRPSHRAACQSRVPGDSAPETQVFGTKVGSPDPAISHLMFRAAQLRLFLAAQRRRRSCACFSPRSGGISYLLFRAAQLRLFQRRSAALSQP